METLPDESESIAKKATATPVGVNGFASSSLRASTEGRIFVFGLALALAGVAALALTWLISARTFQTLSAITATHILFGRAAGLSFGYVAGLGHGVVVPVNMLIEAVLVLLFYPLFVFSWRRLIVIDSLKDFMQSTRAAADVHRDAIRRYGWVGLLLFVWFPFWMTGPIVGCAIGFLIGLRAWVNLTVVLGGTFFAIGCWAVFLKELHEAVAEYGPYASMVLVALIIAVAVCGRVLSRKPEPGKQKKSED